jgi:hypothetical protein
MAGHHAVQVAAVDTAAAVAVAVVPGTVAMATAAAARAGGTRKVRCAVLAGLLLIYAKQLYSCCTSLAIVGACMQTAAHKV